MPSRTPNRINERNGCVLDTDDVDLAPKGNRELSGERQYIDRPRDRDVDIRARPCPTSRERAEDERGP